LEKLFEKEDYQLKDEIQKTRKELKKLKTCKSNLQNDLMDRAITPQDYQDMKNRVDKEIDQIKINSLIYNSKYHLYVIDNIMTATLPKIPISRI
jgi:SMC interacting uncharacterized protein involved in chromosome segregation